VRSPQDGIFDVVLAALIRTESLMENPSFTRVCFSNVRVIIVIMHVSMVELLCQAATGMILALKCLLVR
jgi:hypothetical protein